MAFWLWLSLAILSASAEKPSRHPYTGRYVHTYTDEAGNQKRAHMDVLEISPDGYFNFRDAWGGGRVTDADENEFVFHFRAGTCTYRFQKLDDKGTKILMVLTKAQVPNICPPTSELRTTDFQPYAPAAKSFTERVKDWFSGDGNR